jgi:primosomal protein N' (replication factor Y)
LIPLGFGIESLEEDLESMILQRLAEKKNYDFKFKISRLDRDQITSQSRLDKTLDEFKKGESQILLGTQMLVKGHDFSNVTLVVVLFADALFRWPDFRAPERAFQTLTQVSGRSGRGLKKGKVMIQTMDPDHPVLKVITGQLSKDEFVKSELEIRKELEQPPFVRMIRYRLISKDKKDLLAHTDEYLKMLYRANEQLKNPIMILGPVQPLIEKLNHHFRQDVYLRSADIPNLRQLHTYAVALLRSERQKRSFDFQIDVDPISL